MQILGWSRWALAIWGGWAVLSLGLIAGGLFALGGLAGAALAAVGLLLLGRLVYGLWRLRYVDRSGWLITWDIPEPLQFSAYIGQQEQFSFADTATPRSAAEQQWRGWWQSLPGRLFDHHARLDDLLRSHADLPPLELWRTVGARPTLDADPPAFDSLSEQPALQSLCRRHWPGFERQWQIEKPELIGKMRRQGLAVREERIVRGCVRAAGKTSSAPFSLRLDFVRWPETYQRRDGDQHLVLSARYLEPSAAAELRAIIAACVTPLV